MLYLKNLHLTIPVVLTYLLFSCSQPQNCNNGVQDGSETGIDCGGNCPPCPSNNGGGNNSNPPNTTLQDIQGLWYYNMSVHGQGATITDHKHFIQIYMGTNCLVDFTSNNPTPYTNNTTMYDMYGYFTGCSYPTQGGWYYNTTNNTLNTSYLVDIDNDTLHLDQTSADLKYVLNRFARTTSNSNTVTFEVELASSYPNSNEVFIDIIGTGMNDTIPIVPGQLTYSVTKSINLATSSPYVIFSVGSNLTSTGNFITCTSRVIMDNTVIAETSPHTFCVSNGTFNCNGFELLGNYPLATIYWYF